MSLIFSSSGGFVFKNIPEEYKAPTDTTYYSYFKVTPIGDDQIYVFQNWNSSNRSDITGQVKFFVRKGKPLITKKYPKSTTYEVCKIERLPPVYPFPFLPEPVWSNKTWGSPVVSLPCFKKFMSSKRLTFEIENRKYDSVAKVNDPNRGITTQFVDCGPGMECLSCGETLGIGNQRKLIRNNQLVHIKPFVHISNARRNIVMKLSLFMETESNFNVGRTDFKIISVRDTVRKKFEEFIKEDSNSSVLPKDLLDIVGTYV